MLKRLDVILYVFIPVRRADLDGIMNIDRLNAFNSESGCLNDVLQGIS